jgi:hypothetical protein
MIKSSEQNKIKKCKFCKAKIVWLKTRQTIWSESKPLACDANSVAPDDQFFDPKRRCIFDEVGHVPHFKTCVKAEQLALE